MKKMLFAIVVSSLFFAGSALADMNVGMNSYAGVTGYDVAGYTADMTAVAPGFQMETQHGAIAGVWNGGVSISQYTDAYRGAGVTLVSSGTEGAVNAGWWGVAGLNAGTNTNVSIPNIQAFMDGNIDLSSAFGGSASGSASQFVVILNNAN